LVIIILPKIQRVWSGEKVVMTAVLGSRFSDKNSTQNVINEGTPPIITDKDEEKLSSKKVWLEEGDPLPRTMEEHVFTLSNLLRGLELKLYVVI
jgi:hypothetical protein